MQRAVQLVENTTAFQKYDGKLIDKPFPGCENFKLRSKEYMECYARHFSLTMYHPTSTCTMGRKDDPIAVVDSQLRVKGIKGLRVVDASIMPTVVAFYSGNKPTVTLKIFILTYLGCDFKPKCCMYYDW